MNRATTDVGAELLARADWTGFRTLDGLTQKAGVGRDRLVALLVKEVVDNALDAAGDCSLDEIFGDDRLCNGFVVRDDGPGIAGDDEAVARLFSFRRPMLSTKLGRLPSRGALGNGLRVVAGAVCATGGSLAVETRGRRLELAVRDHGGAEVRARSPARRDDGTAIEVRLGAALEVEASDFDWGRLAIRMARAEGSIGYRKGKSSPWWYDPDAFYEWLQCQDAGVPRALSALEGCAHPKSARIAAPYKGRAAAELSREEAADLLVRARDVAKEVLPQRLGSVGREVSWGSFSGYNRACYFVELPGGRGGPPARLPVVVEAWAIADDDASFTLFVNRTPAAVEMVAWHDAKRSQMHVRGAGLSHWVPCGRRSYRVWVNVQTPYMPRTSDGKAPDLLPFLGEVAGPLTKAIGGAKRWAAHSSPEWTSDKDAIFAVLDRAIAVTSGDGTYRYSLRQLYYKARELVGAKHGRPIEYGNFTKVVTLREAELGHDLPGIYRDNRGTLYVPHTGETIPLGTLSVEDYRHQRYVFNKVLYIEKEGFFALLKEAGWPERNDCALLTGKGYATRAVKDLLDLLGDSGEDLDFYCAHDADAAGTMIYQTLQEASPARAARAVRIVELGLDPEEAQAMGLPPEDVENKKDARRPVAARYKGTRWAEWLQSHRVELNAMSSPQFLDWLDGKFADQAGKLVPPPAVLADDLRSRAEEEFNRTITARVLAAADLPGKVAAAMTASAGRLAERAEALVDEVPEALEDEPAWSWRIPVRDAARAIVADAPDGAPM